MIFCFENYSDLIEKVRYERSLVNTSSANKKSDIYPLFNIVLTLNHIFEWFYKDEKIDTKLRAECIKIFNTYDNQDNHYKQFI